jgi:ABC-2 type transport system permease protein
MFISGMPLLACIAGNAWLGLEPDLSAYAFTYSWILIPNLLFVGVMVFGLVAVSRNIYAGFILVLLLFMLPSITDPFGELASLKQTASWSFDERSRLPLGATDALWINRLGWMLLASVSGMLAYTRFSLSQFGWRFSMFSLRRKRKRSIDVVFPGSRLGVLVSQEVRFILRHWLFLLFCVMGVMLIGFMLNKVLHTNEVVMLPLTRLILHIPAFFHTHLIVMATFVFAGMIVLRASDSQMEPLIFSTSMPTWTWVASKAISIVVMQAVLLLLLMVTGIGIQRWNHDGHVDLFHYLTTLFLLQAPVLAVWGCLSVALFSLTRNLYSGLFILLLAWLAQFGYEQLGITTRLLQFNTHPMLILSDMDGFGHDLAARLVMQAYWFAWGLIFLFIAVLITPRNRRSRMQTIGFGGLVVGLSALAVFIHTEESKIIRMDESQDIVRDVPDIPQPRIVSVSIRMDLYPEERRFLATGEYVLVNKTMNPIDTLIVKSGFDEETQIDIQASNRTIDSIPEWNIRLHLLAKPLQPGDSLRMSFAIRNQPNSLFQRNSGVLGNGTFLSHDILPRLGFPHDSTDSGNHYFAWDSDRVEVDITVSTSTDQQAFSNGMLIRQWNERGRNVYEYRSTEPIKFNFFFMSGRFETHHDSWNGIPITVHHHPAHTQNLDDIVDGVKAALDLNGRLFAELPKEEIRIIEYPLSEGTHNTLKSNTILMSESVFGVNTNVPGKLNMPFYVAAHEMTHHWFGNRLLPADAKGAVFLTESLTEYLTSTVFDSDFLRVQQQRYIRGRATASGDEPPLYLVEAGQEHISYGKGAVVLNAVAEEMGRQAFHNVLTEFFATYQGMERYPTSMEFIAILRKHASDRQWETIGTLLGVEGADPTHPQLLHPL